MFIERVQMFVELDHESINRCVLDLKNQFFKILSDEIVFLVEIFVFEDILIQTTFIL